MKKFLIIICIFFSLPFIVYGKDIKKECKYTFQYELYDSGNSSNNSAKEGGVIDLKIYRDGSQDGSSSGGQWLVDFGGNKSISNWGKTQDGISDIKSDNCPNYIGVLKRVGVGNITWYGFNNNTISLAKKLAGESSNYNIDIFKLINPADNTDKTTQDILSCSYDTMDIKIDFNSKTITSDSLTAGYNIIRFVPSDDLKKAWFKSKKKDCFGLYMCKTNDAGMNYNLYSDELQAIIDGATDNCEWKCLKDDTACTKKFCSTYDDFITSIKNYYKEYSECKLSNCKIKNLNKANEFLDKLKASCASALSNLNYNSPCVIKCLKLEEEINSQQIKYGIIGSSNDDCGLTTKITTFLYNIFKWVKYIVPVLVIILSILDFIKAIASSQEEDLKKAQSRFVKRLIVAALLFLLPLIINFMLSTFGLYNKDCDITNMF